MEQGYTVEYTVERTKETYRKTVGQPEREADSEQVVPVTVGQSEQPENQKSGRRMVFGFRADPEQVKVWKIYAETMRMNLADMGSEAMEEYMKNHAPEGKLKQVFELMLKERM